MVKVSTSPQRAHRDSETIFRLAAERRRRETASLAILASVVIVVIAVTFATRGIRTFIPESTLLAILGAAVVQVIFSAWNARCPACDKHIGRLLWSAQFCPHCGTQLKSNGADAG